MLHMHLQFGSPAVKGESADKDHQGWIELKSWDHSIVQPRSATASTAGGHTMTRCEHGDMIFTKEIDSSARCCTNTLRAAPRSTR